MFALPNALTIARIVLVPIFAIAFVMPGPEARLVAFAVFALAGISDWLDGFAARKLKAGSDFGRMLDPIADKVLVAVALMMLVAEGTFTQVTPNGMLSLHRTATRCERPVDCLYPAGRGGPDRPQHDAARIDTQPGRAGRDPGAFPVRLSLRPAVSGGGSGLDKGCPARDQS